MRLSSALFAFVTLSAIVLGQDKIPKPGFNLFSREQDVQMGREYAAQVEKQMIVVHNAELSAYIQRIGDRLTRQPEAGQYPYSFQVVQEKSINAFALPGGPTFVHTGLITAAENEAQIAGVLAHEISHVALRHGTNQASKAQLLSIPAALTGVVGGGTITGTLAQLGIGLGANSLILKYSRGAESDADLLGARIMNGAGYNPIEMARFFEKLEAESGKGNFITQFLSDHPNPGNRVKAVQDEIRYLPKQAYLPDSGDLPRMKKIIEGLPEPKPQTAPQTADPASARPSGGWREYRGREVTFNYPGNWEVQGQGEDLTIGSRSGIFNNQVAYGLMAAFFEGRRDLRGNTEDLINKMRQGNQGLNVAGAARPITVGGSRALRVHMQSQSAYGGVEVDELVAIERPGGIYYLMLVAPDREWGQASGVFDQMVASVRFLN